MSRRGFWPLLSVSVLLLSFVLLAFAVEDSARFDNFYTALLIFNGIGFVGLGWLIGLNIFRLWQQHRVRAPGSALTLRLVVVFVVLAVTPVLAVFSFSVQFLQRGIESWFDVRVEQALEASLELGQSSLDLRMRELLNRTQAAAARLQGVSDDVASIAVDDLRSAIGAEEALLLGSNGRIVATSSQNPVAAFPDRPGETILQQVRNAGSYVAVEPVASSGFQGRVAVRVGAPGTDVRILQALFPLSERVNEQLEGVEQAYTSYKKITYLRDPLKLTFTITLSMVLLLSLAFAVWAAFYFARRLSAPIRDLATGTRAVAMGDYGQTLPMPKDDEMGRLVGLFNAMTQRLAAERDAAVRSRREVESQRAYSQALLRHLSSGVMSFDADACLRTANASASSILGVRLDRFIGASIDDLRAQGAVLSAFLERVASMLERGERSWDEQIEVMAPGGRKTLVCQSAQLAGLGGHVIVFDDVTTLLQAQRDAAWGEVARRLAHEIKNPLTPIQLSAERLRHRCSPKVDSKDAQIFDRATSTIIAQVVAMKEMVDAFSQYAKPPSLSPKPLDLNALVREVAELYRRDGLRLKLDLADGLPPLRADTGRLRQMLHNLIKNAVESVEGQAKANVVLSSAFLADDSLLAGGGYVVLSVSDNGGGIDEAVLPKLFEPYVTSKPKGTGLGLAIVKKIVEEHGGMIRAANLHASAAGEGFSGSYDGDCNGARFVVQLPVDRGESPSSRHD